MTHSFRTITATSLAVTALLFAGTAGAEDSELTAQLMNETPLQTALENLPEDVRLYNDHLTFLASPFCDGRLPGTNGMEIARQYMEYHFTHAGLEPAFNLTDTDSSGHEVVRPRATFRQPFPLGGTTEITEEILAVDTPDGSMSMEVGTDFHALSVGGSGEATGEMVFVGYSITEGENDYSSYREDDDLTGKIAVMFRFEPMDEEGNSQWSDGRWTRRAGFHGKIRAAQDRGAAGVIIINPPGANDSRTNSVSSGGSGRSSFDVPVSLVSIEAGERLVEAADPDGRSLMDLRRYADEGGAMFDMKSGVKATLSTKVEVDSLMAENVGAILPGRGDLADEYIVIGAHLDHLGMGEFGSRRGAGRLHPGADDNASGSAGILLVADSLAKSYAELPDDADLRSIVFIGFDAEESGLNGSRYYVRNPIVPIENHVLMMNFDMIGRIKDHRVSVSGASTADGFEEFLQPMFDASGMEVVQPGRMSGASDHSSFLAANMPVLFAIIADFHGDYHTPDDVSWKINRVDATKTCRLWADIALASAQVPEFFPFQDQPTRSRAQRASRGEIKVHFGIVPGSYNEDDEGVLISDTTPNSPAELGGVKGGDRLIRWNGQKIENIGAWMGMLAEHEPGDVVDVTVVRDDTEVVLKITLKGRETPDEEEGNEEKDG